MIDGSDLNHRPGENPRCGGATCQVLSSFQGGAVLWRIRGFREADYTVSRLRPFARRLLSTFRPLAVLMRLRKPCTFRRLRLWG